MTRSIAYLMLLAAACGGEAVETESAVDQTSGSEFAYAEPNPAAVPVQDEAPPDPQDVHIEGDHITVDGHINFATDSDTILENSNELLDHIAQLINNHATEISHLKIIGHTDESGDHDHNVDLSNRRAAAVEAALLSRGVAVGLEHEGRGETEPLCTEDTDECHAQNRRVEFLIVADPAVTPAEPAPIQ